MKLENTINKYFNKEKIVDSICKYQLYYQIGLGSLALQSIQDIVETDKKLKELNLQISSQKVFEAMHEIVLHLSHKDDFEDQFEQHLRFTALAQMLNDFIEADKELISTEHFSDMIYNQIKDDRYFTNEMNQQLDADYKVIYPVWESAITDEIVLEIQDVVSEMLVSK